jgi:hypothetical protein
VQVRALLQRKRVREGSYGRGGRRRGGGGERMLGWKGGQSGDSLYCRGDGQITGDLTSIFETDQCICGPTVLTSISCFDLYFAVDRNNGSTQGFQDFEFDKFVTGLLSRLVSCGLIGLTSILPRCFDQDGMF